jgi:signal transduction histidine kinase
VERVVANLVSNAIKYSPGGGDVRVELAAEAGWAVLRVQDQGVGIPAADLPRVFEQFHRAANVAGRIGGTGLGLAGARHIVEQHGGSIALESQEGVGTTVTVRLPLN